MFLLKLKIRYLTIIHRWRLFIARIWGHNIAKLDSEFIMRMSLMLRKDKVYVKEFLCSVCGRPLNKRFGERTRYHGECRKFRKHPHYKPRI